MPKEIEPSSYQCDCGYAAHFAENTVKEAKERSQAKRQPPFTTVPPSPNLVVQEKHGDSPDEFKQWPPGRP